MNKKAITTVVATSLLIIVTIFSIITFQNFYQTYSTNLMSKAETDTKINPELKIEGIIEDELYLISEQNIETLDIFDSNHIEVCNLNYFSSPYLKHYFSFDENNITYIKDLIDDASYGNSEITSAADTTYVDWSSQGYLNGALYGSGVNTERARFYISENITYNQSFSISLWVNPIKYNDSYDYSIIFESPMIKLNSDGTLYVRSPSTVSWPYATTNNPIPLNKWTNIIVTVNTTDNTKHYIKVYLNGIDSTYNSFIGSGTLTPYSLLKMFSAYSNSYAGNLNGKIDELKIYDKALTQEEVTQLYTNNKINSGSGSKIKTYDLKECNLDKDETYEIISSNGYTVKSEEIYYE